MSLVLDKMRLLATVGAVSLAADASFAVLVLSFDQAYAQETVTDPLQELGQRVHQDCGSSGNLVEHCLTDLLSDTAIEHATSLATREGQSAFGERFRLYSRMTLEPSGDLTGDLDAVIPLSSGSTEVDGSNADTAFFLQQGITSWRGGDGDRRNDIRLGMVYRFPVSESDALGVSLLYQENLEREHQRLAFGMDYGGRWGTGYISHFEPITNWQPGRPGYEERARGGTELGARMTLTSTLSADVATGRWDGDSDHIRNARLGVNWRPHPWVNFGIGYEDNYVGAGTVEDGARLSASFGIPLGHDGGTSPRPRWQGLGVAGSAKTSPDLWAPITNVGRIATVERVVEKTVVRSAALKGTTGDPDAVTRESISAEFLQSDAMSGSNIGVRVSISEPLSADLELVVRLVPGSGTDPAVPGEDFVDDPNFVTIEQGEVQADAWFQLLHNSNMETARSLAVEVSLAD